MSLESSEWRCPHGHTKEEHRVCYETAKREASNNKTLDKWLHAGKARFTTSGKMFRVTVDDTDNYFFFIKDFWDILAGHRHELTLWRIEKGSQRESSHD